MPLSAKHVCLLFRRFTSWEHDVTRPYVDALEARGIPHVLVGGKTFHDREEVETIRAALAAIEWPDDELSVFATLRGALFAIGDEELLDWRRRWGVFHPFRVRDGAPEPIASALRVLPGDAIAQTASNDTSDIGKRMPEASFSFSRAGRCL